MEKQTPAVIFALPGTINIPWLQSVSSIACGCLNIQFEFDLIKVYTWFDDTSKMRVDCMMDRYMKRMSHQSYKLCTSCHIYRQGFHLWKPSGSAGSPLDRLAWIGDILPRYIAGYNDWFKLCIINRRCYILQKRATWRIVPRMLFYRM